MYVSVVFSLFGTHLNYFWVVCYYKAMHDHFYVYYRFLYKFTK